MLISKPWGPFGRGWSLKQFLGPDRRAASDTTDRLSQGLDARLDQPIVAEVVYLDAKTEADLESTKVN